MRDLLIEILESVKRNKMRTCLTGFAVAWGIFMLIVLLGAGNGIMNSFNKESGSFAANTIMFGGSWTSKPYDGLKAGRRIRLEDKDVSILNGKLYTDIIDDVSATIGVSTTASLGSRHVKIYIEGNYPQIAQMNNYDMVCGRFINEKDIRDCRKIMVMPENIAEKFLPDGADATDIIGKYIKADNFLFLVVGVTKKNSMDNSNTLFAPFSTVRTVFNTGKDINNITFSFHGLETEEESDEFENSFRSSINSIHRAAPDDTRSIWIWNRFTQNIQMKKATRILQIALWIIGLFTLLSGIVGISNIMLITVKERTHEFGIRKAIGAKPWSIMKLIVSESVIITSIFGYLGMLLGLATCEILDNTLGQKSMEIMGEEITVLLNPTVGIDVAIEATAVLIIAGTIAGIIPARKAAKVRPIEALRAE